MRLALALLLFVPFPTFAADTSGCSPMSELAREAVTPSGGSIRATLFRAPLGGCWNEGESSMVVEYRFTLPGRAENPRVKLWIGVNGAGRDSAAFTRCEPAPSRTGPVTATLCTATASVPAPPRGPMRVEIAPSVDGNWDTAGYGHNVTLGF